MFIGRLQLYTTASGVLTCVRSRLTASLMMESIYGHTVTSSDDEYLHYAEAALKGTTEVASPGAAIVDILPFCECYLAFTP